MPEVLTDTSNTFGLNAPRPLLDLYHGEIQRHHQLGLEDDEAHRRAIRCCQHAGWYKTSKGWKQVAPNVRGKVNVTEAVKQPDGNFLIEGVPVFYPNAVKGINLAFSADNIRQIINNTNRSIQSGAPKPVVIEGHPTEEQQDRGLQLDAHGSAINFREDPNKPGFAICDLIDVEPRYVQRMKARNLPSLSVGFAKDAHGLQRRFGHVALLGGTSQALAHNPATEVFSAVSGNYLCFSADQEFCPERTNPMKMSDKQKACFAALYSACQGMEAAQKSAELGEPEADGKNAEAYSAMFKSVKDMFDAADTEAAAVQPQSAVSPKPDGSGGEPPIDTTGAYDADTTAAPAMFASLKETFESDPSAAFSAMLDQVADLKKVNDLLRTKDRANTNRMRHEKFQAEIVTLRKSGRTLPGDDTIKEQFHNAFETKDPEKSLALVLKAYKALPVASTPATFNNGNPVFDARDTAAKAITGKPLTKKDLAGTKPDLSDEDMMYAALGDSLA